MITLTLNIAEVFSSDKKEYPCRTNHTSFSNGSLVSLVSARDSIKLNNKAKIDDKDAVVIIKDHKGRVSELRVNGKVIPKEKWTTEELQTVMNKRMPAPPTPPAFSELPAPPTPPQSAPPGFSPVPPKPPIPPIPPCSIKDMQMKDSKEWKKFNAEMEKFDKEMEKWKKKYESGLEDYEKQMEQWQKENEPKFEEFGKQMDIWEKENAPKWEAFGKEMGKWALVNEPQMKVWAKQFTDNFEGADHGFKFKLSTVRNDVLENELLADKLIKSGQNYNFSISGKKKELRVNGIKQSNELFEKYNKLMKQSTADSDSDYEISISKQAN
ncbi:hypothetical protein [Solitalea koreensis]|uniref:Uncharacterized protein n=1 Tax=Solitalea koreensis TaxID=543615 RepID=A0A521EB48_9SPHI|nr:hypothetical protein [Solitalea koreensis]SMO81168.1 hypothetical protein SAMN06265350_1134 [Solitalea koreensis]